MRDPVLDHATNLQQKAVWQQIDFASPNKNPEDPTNKRKIELQDQLNEIRSQQGVGKNSRTAKLDEIKRLNAQLKSRRDEKKDFEAQFGTEEKLNAQLNAIRSSMESGMLRLAEEKAADEELKRLANKKKLFANSKDKNDSIGELEAKIKEIKDSMDDPESKELSENYTKLQTELNAIKAKQNEASKGLDSLYAEKNKLQKQQKETWAAKKKLQDEYHQQRKAFQKYDYEQKQKIRERRQAEHDRYEKEKKLERAQKMLADASDPAYLDEIRRANSLLQYYDPSFVAEKAPLQPSANLQAQAERKVDGSDLKGVKVLSKKDRDEDLFPAQKKGKKGKKHNAAATKTTFNCPPSVLEDCSYLGIDPPMSADDVPGVIEKVKAKLDHWKADQAAQTQKVRYIQLSLIISTNILFY